MLIISPLQLDGLENNQRLRVVIDAAGRYATSKLQISQKILKNKRYRTT